MEPLISPWWGKNARVLTEPMVRLAFPSASIREASLGSEQWLMQRLTTGQNAETVEYSALTRTPSSSLQGPENIAEEEMERT